ARREAAAPTRAARKRTVPRTATPGASRSRDPRRRVRRMPALVPTTGTRDATILAEPPASAAVAAGDGASVPTAETRRRFLKTSSAMKLDRRAGPTGTTRTKLAGKISRRGAGAAATGRSVTRRSLLRTLHRPSVRPAASRQELLPPRPRVRSQPMAQVNGGKHRHRPRLKNAKRP